MALDADTVRNIAHLARLQIDDAAVPGYAAELSSILNLVEQMEQVDTGGVKPLSNPLDAVQRLRADQVTESNQRDAMQAVAPKTANGLYLVPKVIE